MTIPIPDGLIDYLAAHDHTRNQEIDTALNTLTPREQALVREAAVMGYVQGTTSAPDENYPRDTVVLRLVVAACLAMPDLYPTIARGDR